jgi:hypothetical protein
MKNPNSSDSPFRVPCSRSREHVFSSSGCPGGGSDSDQTRVFSSFASSTSRDRKEVVRSYPLPSALIPLPLRGRAGVRVFLSSLLFICSLSPALLLPCSPALAQDAPATPMATLFSDSLKAESASYLSIWLQNTALKQSDLADPTQFTIQSDTDPNYAPSKKVAPNYISARCRLTRLSNRKNLMVKTTAIFLGLPTPMKPGATYTITSTLAGIPASPVTYNDKATVSDNIKVNQVGYLPDQAKIAYLGQYAGTKGPLPLSSDSFQLLDSTGKTVFSGKPTLRDTQKPSGAPADWSARTLNETLTGQDLYELDFTSFKTPGSYRIYIPSIGLSYPFDISPTALNAVYVNLMRGNLIQRCGGDIPLSLTRHGHEACHIDDAFVDPKALTSGFIQQPKDKKGKIPLYQPVHESEQRKATHGHHDAGDYGKYTTNGCNFIAYPLQMMRLYPDKYQQDNLGMPNSGNGVPDVLEEVKWELDWVQNMQDDDGGVFGVIRPNTGGYENSVPPRENRRFLFPKDTVSTASFAAALAHAATHPQIQKHYPDDAKRYLTKALKAWDWLEKNKAYTEYWHYGSLFKDTDELNWAAVELYAATGDAKFHDYFLKNFKPEEARWGWETLVECIGHANRRYAFLKDRPTDPAMQERCKAILLKTADTHVNNTNQFPYRIAMPPESIRFQAYGWVFPAATWSYNLLTANALKPSPVYIQAALSQVDYMMGANPSGYCLQTGIGHKRNIEIVHNPSNYDRIIEPAPGITSGIGSAGIYWLNQYGRSAGEGTFPAGDKPYPVSFPLMNRWYDGFNVNTEFTVDMSIRETLTLGFFAGESNIKPVQPKVTIVADKLMGPAPLAIKFNAKVEGGSGKPKFYFWDFDDESFSTDANPSHTFPDDGRQYNVALTVVDENGYMGYHVVKVACTRPNLGKAQGVLNSTVLYLPLDGSINDAGPNKLKAELVDGRPGNPKMQWEDAPLWMEKPAGKSLAMFGREQIKITIPNDLANKIDQRMTIQARLYVEEFAGWGYEGSATCLGINHHDDSCLNIRQDKWDRTGFPKVGAGKATVMDNKDFGPAFPKNKWVQVKLVFNGVDKTEFYIDDKLVASAKGCAINPSRKNDMTFFVGPFIGKVDDISLTLEKPSPIASSLAPSR